jgi:hypothetical protein
MKSTYLNIFTNSSISANTSIDGPFHNAKRQLRNKEFSEMGCGIEQLMKRMRN